MEKKRQYPGLDVVKFILALLVAQRHVIQIFFVESSRWRTLIGSWLSNLAVPVFFIISGFLLFRKVEERDRNPQVIRRFCWRSIRLYLLWSVLYWGTDFYNWYHGEQDLAAGIREYTHRFLFDSTIPQLWYLPALAVAGFLVWFFYTRGMKLWLILIAGAALLAAGVIGDNWYFNQRLPMRMQQGLQMYRQVFLTMRNGVFYGFFYVAVGLAFARTRRRLPVWAAFSSFAASLAAMYWEVTHCYNTNFTFFAAPAAIFLFMAASQLELPERKLYPRLRAMSEWIYLSHFYFFYFLTWLRPWIPVPLDSKNVTALIILPMVLFSWVMVRLSETKGGAWIKKLI